MARVAFLPGAGGKQDFWRPAAEYLDLSDEGLRCASFGLKSAS